MVTLPPIVSVLVVKGLMAGARIPPVLMDTAPAMVPLPPSVAPLETVTADVPVRDAVALVVAVPEPISRVPPCTAVAPV